MGFWDFWNAHPFIAWCALWLLWAVFALAVQVLRTIRVLFRGWPPPGLDADGDHKADSEVES